MNGGEICKAAEEYTEGAMRLRQLRDEDLHEYEANYESFIAGVEWCLKIITKNDKGKYN